MMRHISMFRLKPECRTEANVEALRDRLLTLPESNPSILSCEIGAKPFAMPDKAPGDGPDFYDLVQIITFGTPEECAAYPMTQGHLDLLATSSPLMEKVVVIEYPV